MDIGVLVNAGAGRGRYRAAVPDVLARLGAAGRLRVLAADSPGQAEQACHRAVAEGVSALVAVGGDGTVHRAVQAVAGRPVGFGVVPAGTGNDFADAIGVPRDPVGAAERIAAALGEDRTRTFDLARVSVAGGEPRWFATVLAAGFDAVVNERANGMRWPRGRRRYDLAILLELARLRPVRYRLVLDDDDLDVTGVLVAVGNCPSYGGGLRMCPDADPRDGRLDVVLVAPLGRVTLIRLTARLRAGTHVRDTRVRTVRVRRARLAAVGIVAYADGERVGPLPVDVECVRDAVRVLL